MAKAKAKEVGKFSAGCYICRTYVPDLTFDGQKDAVFNHLETHPEHFNTVGGIGEGNFVTEKFRVVSLDEFLKA